MRAAALAFVLALAPAAALAEDASTFELAEAPAQARQRVEAAIDRAIAPMSFVIRGFARGRLRDKNPVHRRVTTQVEGDRITVTYDGDRFETTSGRWQEVTAGGERVQLLQQTIGHSIVQTFRSADGEKTVVIRPSADGRSATLEITVTSPRLPEALRYRVPYRSAASG